MTSKECLERLLKNIVVNETILITKYGYSALNDIETIKQDLDRLEKLEKAIEILKEHNLQVYHIPDFTTPYLSLNDYGDGSSISIKEYKLLKEVFRNETKKKKI